LLCLGTGNITCSKEYENNNAKYGETILAIMRKNIGEILSKPDDFLILIF